MSQSSANQTPRVIVSWAIVGIPLAYGFVQTLKNALHIFTG
ncbi:hypothetical protein GCM10011584_07570 [Nocardioides phosphati]|uniref:Uncharacterized protein n=1 Tax=Nocardioides phosphati TaxID=1867775 RepID=A0ABQ2N7U2_9ACTN|nr:oxalate:formate antiporter [Nocardioides phosphati]GGO86079.1 hypothetical protein GCM10011584_07570 [Nocardioides phosphati]